jgi:thiaminase/transcriptional activator TenA
MASLTERLREEAGDLWRDVVEHPFTDAIASGAIDEDAMRFYLIQDHRFLDDFVVLLASMVRPSCTACPVLACQGPSISSGRTRNLTWGSPLPARCQVAAAPTLADRIQGCQFLALITGKENTYFERSFEALGVSAEQRQVASTPNDAATTGFQNLMRT